MNSAYQLPPDVLVVAFVALGTPYARLLIIQTVLPFGILSPGVVIDASLIIKLEPSNEKEYDRREVEAVIDTGKSIAAYPGAPTHAPPTKGVFHGVEGI